jgi:hypothetical protein
MVDEREKREGERERDKWACVAEKKKEPHRKFQGWDP